MNKTTKDLLILTAITVTSTLILWLPFLLKLPSFWGIPLPQEGFETVWKNYDGLNYIIVAKSLYEADSIKSFPQDLPVAYFAAHFPLYPWLIRLFAVFGSYIDAMLAVSVGFSVAAVLSFYYLVKQFRLPVSPLWLSIVFLFLPARWFVVRSVGAPEPVFVTFVILAMLFFIRAQEQSRLRNYALAGVFGALATLTKSPGILLFIGFGVYLLIDAYRQTQGRLAALTKHIQWIAYPLLLIPLSLVLLFGYYGVVFTDPLAYFHSGDNIHVSFPPLQVFNASQAWVGEFWLEDIIWYFCIYLVAFFWLIKRKFYHIASFFGVFLLATIMVAHRDIARYSLPLAPFALLAFAEFIDTKPFRYTFYCVLIAIYLYALNFLVHNIFPVANIGSYL